MSGPRETGRASRYLYVDGALAAIGEMADERLDACSERHRIELEKPMLVDTTRLRSAIADHPGMGLVLEMGRGWPGRQQIAHAMTGLWAGRRVLFHWPTEHAVEVIDADRIVSYSALWFRAALYRRRHGPPNSEASYPPDLELAVADKDRLAVEIGAQARSLMIAARPHPMVATEARETSTGVYLRTDFWAPITTGGSYGHTCYVAKELARSTGKVICFLPNRLDLLDDIGVRQVLLDRPPYDGSEQALLAGGPALHMQLRAALEALRPAYIYERLCLGNLVGARLSLELEIPYVLEYNGSEISMRRSFAGESYEHTELFELLEDAAFAQATVISVVSDVIRDSLVARGVDPGKILVNPNGADPDSYSPPSADERTRLRSELGFGPDHQVVGFIGTFGGWHGIDVLAAALPTILDRCPNARFLLIGDGAHRRLIDQAVATHGLSDKVVLPGRVAHTEGARLLGACDLFVSPHSADMVDSPFFGSPTKLFEYMALGQGIVASDLEQIGEVLSPALRAVDVGRTRVDRQRAVLCTPADVDDFVQGVTALIDDPDVAVQLGVNARRALVEEYSWQRHVARLWSFEPEGISPTSRTMVAPTTTATSGNGLASFETGSADKDEVQKQWDNDPCGSHYVTKPDSHTLEWFLEAERYRHQEYAPWMPEVMEFNRWDGREVLEIGAGMGTDLAQFARNGATVTDFDLSAGHLALAEKNFALRGLKGTFLHGDAESLPFEDDYFDLVYSNGVIHHTPNTQEVIDNIHRILKPGGQAIIMVYAEHSMHYWRQLIGELGLNRGLLNKQSIGEIMSRHVELSTTDARPLVKVYSARRLRKMFAEFHSLDIVKRQMVAAERPNVLRWVPVELLSRVAGWNLIVKARKRH